MKKIERREAGFRRRPSWVRPRSAAAPPSVEKRLRLIADALPAFVSYITPDHRYLFANATYRRRFGHDPTGKALRDVVGPEAYAFILPYLDRAFRGERVKYLWKGTVEPIGPCWLSGEYVPDVDDYGKVRGIVCQVNDVTEAKENELALSQARDHLSRQAEELDRAVRARTVELQEAVAELEAFAYSVSHDLRAPVRAIQGLLEIHLRNLDIPAEARRERLERVVRAAGRMDALIRDLLAYSSIGRAGLETEPVDLDAVVEEIAAREEFRDGSIDVRHPLGRVVGHAGLVAQAVSNLIDNALKFVKPGEDARVRVWSERRAPGRLRLFVEDQGIGIETGMQERIFKPFERLHAPGTYEGTGIGLAIVKRTAERLGGGVGARSRPGRGSRFWFELPEAR